MERIREYLAEAYKLAALHSTDTSTQNCALLIDSSGNIVSWGVNKFPRGVAETPARLERPTKYLYVVHAEDASIAHAAENGVKTAGLTMVGTWVACNECAKPIIESGIKRVIGHKSTFDASPEHWKEPIRIAMEMFRDSGVSYELWDGHIGGVEIRFNQQPFRP